MNKFERASKVIPGGVNSPVRAFGSVGGEPFYVDHAEGSKLYDTNGNMYIDYIGSWGPMILGHTDPDVINAVKNAADKGTSYGACTEGEIELAELITGAIPSVEMVRMVSSGTEAVMSAIRLARGYTGRDKIIKFEGCYHGHSDGLLVKAGSGLLTFGTPSSPGVPEDITKNTVVAEYNNIRSVKKIFNQNKDQIACIIVEPVAANMGVVLPESGFLEDLRELCTAEGALLIFDEVITGFRLAYGGAQEYFGVQADITTLGKIIGGGLPVGAYGGSRKIMEHISPVGKVYQAGTLSGNPLAMAAGIQTLKKLREPGFYDRLNDISNELWNGFNDNLKKLSLDLCFNKVGSLGCLYFTGERVNSFYSAMKSDTAKYAKYFHEMLSRGIFLAPAQFEAMFVSIAHTPKDIEKTLAAHYDSLKAME